MGSEPHFRPLPRNVTPARTPVQHHDPIIAVTGDTILSETDGEIPRGELVDYLRWSPPSTIATTNPEGVLHEVLSVYADDPLFNFRVTTPEKTNIGQRTVRIRTVIRFFGWRERVAGARGKGGGGRFRYHHPLVPGVFTDQLLTELYPLTRRPQALLRFGRQVREWCELNNLRVSTTSGAVAAQLLRSPQFYPEPRRKVPVATNEKARPHLPGGYFQRHPSARGHTVYPTVIEYDQRRAHHHAARTLRLPCANTLMAKGYFRCKDYRAYWTPQHLYKYHEHGLIRAMIRVPQHTADRAFRPPWAYAGEHEAYLFTNELSELVRFDCELVSVAAAWTSNHTDTGLQRYSEWADQELDLFGAQVPWLKPTLLSTYGILAAKPSHHEAAYLRAKKGDTELIHVGSMKLPLHLMRTRVPHQAQIANVIHRGMIEAETRRLCFAAIDRLSSHGWRVLAVRADAVFIEPREDEEPPELPPPFEREPDLHEVTFPSEQALRSKTKSKLPGVARTRRVAVSNVHSR